MDNITVSDMYITVCVILLTLFIMTRHYMYAKFKIKRIMDRYNSIRILNNVITAFAIICIFAICFMV